MMIQLAIPSIVRKFSQLICTAASVVSMSLALFPSTAQAVGADGNFRVTGGKGSFTANGKTEKIPKSVFNEITKDPSAAMVVKGQKVRINRKVTGAFFENLFPTEAGVILNPKITGPTSITFKPVGNYFAAKTLQPIVTKFSVKDDKGKRVSVTVKTNVDATVKGNILTLNTRFIATDGEEALSGVLTLIGQQ